jgi:epoxyqueuosine reductase
VKEALLTFAQELGFDLCRIARCSAPPHAAEFRQWLAEGRAGEMAWLERNQERRTDPQQVLPGARAVITLALSYHQKREPQPASTGARGRIAQYAWGDDYHEVIERKLRSLDEWLIARGGVQKCYVDTGPMLERDFAALSGVGWHGKSTMLIHPQLGTWFFLAEILTTLGLEPDAPLPDRCGSCTRCIDRLPHRRDYGAAPARCAALRLVSHHRAERQHPRRAAPADRRPHLRLRRLPHRLPVEPFRASLTRSGVQRAAPLSTACCYGIFSRSMMSSFGLCFGSRRSSG